MPEYIGRFAPSPTGPLHMGSLLAALVSYLDARKNNGQWLVRIEDIDPPREQPSSVEQILRTLEIHGFHWDQEIRYQSSCTELYEAALSKLYEKGLCYWCPCSRKQLAERHGEHLPSCGKSTGKHLNHCALRFRGSGISYKWPDLLLGSKEQTIDNDFILKRRDGLYSYQLAVVADDIDQRISHVIRGADLLDSTPMQLALYEALDAAPPKFGHFPLVVNKDGQKFSKQNFAPAVNDQTPLDNLGVLSKWLGMTIPTPPPSHPESYLKTLAQQWGRTSFESKNNYVL